MNIKLVGTTFPKIQSESSIDFRISESLKYVMLCHIKKGCDKFVSAQRVCDLAENIIKSQQKNISSLTEGVSEVSLEDVSSNISDGIKQISKNIRSQFYNELNGKRLEISLEILLFISEHAVLFHVGDIRTYSYQKNDFILVTKDQNNLENWIECKETTYEQGKNEKDAFDLVNGVGLSGVLHLEAKIIPITVGDRFLLVTRSVRDALRSLKLKAIVSAGQIGEVPNLIKSELSEFRTQGSFGFIATEVSSRAQKKSEARAFGFLERFGIIKKSKLFSKLTEEECIKLISICKTKQVSPNSFLIKKGSLDRDLFFILDGQLNIVKDGKTIGAVTNGEVIGEMSAFDPSPRSADVIATRLSYVMAFGHKEFMALLEKNIFLSNKVYKAVLHELMNRVRGK